MISVSTNLDKNQEYSELTKHFNRLKYLSYLVFISFIIKPKRTLRGGRLGNAQKKEAEVPVLKALVFPSRRVVVYLPKGEFRQDLKTALEQAGFWVDQVKTSDALFDLMANQKVHAVIYFSEENGTSWEVDFTRFLQSSFTARFFLVLPSPEIPKVVLAMKLGVAAVFSDGVSSLNLIKEIQGETLPNHSESKIKLDNGTALVGSSKAFRHIQDLIERLQTVDSTVLITGESGTGKEIIARALHENSPFKKGPFMALNCGAISENLLESELFGHVKGAFTDAKLDHKGIFEACDGGTLLLDEVGDMPLLLQVKLLRVLEERKITPVGSNIPVKVNVRVLASTNRDLETLINEGKFRRDLYFRLAVVSMRLPSLRDRQEDIPLLINHYREYFGERFSRPTPPLSYEVWSKLLAYHWPGNIRELKNTIERGVALSPDGILRIEDVLPESKGEGLTFPQFCPLNSANSTPAKFEEIKNCCEKSYLVRLLQQTEGNVSEVARLSGRHRTEIYRQIEKLGLDPKTFQKN